MKSSNRSNAFCKISYLLIALLLLPLAIAFNLHAQSEPPQYNLWEGEWTYGIYVIKIHPTKGFVIYQQIDRNYRSIIAGGKITPTKNSGIDEYSLAGKYTARESTAEFGNSGVMVATFTDLNDFTLATFSFFPEASATPTELRFVYTSANRLASLRVLTKGPDTDGKEIKTGSSLKLYTEITNSGPVALPSGFLKLVISLPLDALDSVRVTKTKNIRKCEIVTSSDGLAAELQCIPLALGPGTPISAVNFRFDIPSSVSGTKFSIQPVISELSSAGVRAPAVLRVVSRKISYRIAKSKGPKLSGACNQLPGKWHFSNGIEHTFNLNHKVVLTFQDVVRPGTWTCVKNTNFGATDYIVEVIYSDGFADSMKLTADGSILSCLFLFAREITTASKIK